MKTFCGQTGVDLILKYMLENKNVILSDIILNLKLPSPTAMRAIDMLKKYKLVKEKRGIYNRREFTLTDKGIKIAEKMREIEKILEGEEDE